MTKPMGAEQWWTMRSKGHENEWWTCAIVEDYAAYRVRLAANEALERAAHKAERWSTAHDHLFIPLATAIRAMKEER